MPKPAAHHLITAILLLSVCAPASAEFAIEMVPLRAGNWEAIRYDTTTGQAWSAQQGKWVAIAEQQAPPRSRYLIRLVAAEDDSWGAIRLDTVSGRTWSAADGIWVEIR